MADGHGGRRRGAGRPTAATIEQKKNTGSEAISRFQERALDDLDRLYEAQRDLALGCFYEGCGACEKEQSECHCRKPEPIRIYRRLPNQKAGSDLLAHTKGKAAVAPQLHADTQIVLSLGCAKCGTDVPRPETKKRTNGGEHNRVDNGEADPDAGGVSGLDGAED